MLPHHFQQQNLHCIPPPLHFSPSSVPPALVPAKMYYPQQPFASSSSSTSSTPSTPTHFPLFMRLPAEIRTLIWELALPDARVYEIMDVPHAKQTMAAVDGLMFANVHREPPPAPLAAVCHESRHLVLRRYRPLTLGRTTKYVDLARDLLLLEPYLLLKRLHRTLHFMSRIPLLRTHMAGLALGTSYGIYTGICHPVLSSSTTSNGMSRSSHKTSTSTSSKNKSNNNVARLLAALTKFAKLKTLLFVVHQEFQFEFDHRYPAPASLLQPPSASSSSALALSLLEGSHESPLPQVVHQAYRFKFDVEANINRRPRRPHLNALQFYPLENTLQNDDDTDDWEELLNNSSSNSSISSNNNSYPLGLAACPTGFNGIDVDMMHDADNGEWCDPWPTNDDWRRFRHRFQRAVVAALQADQNAFFIDAAAPAGDRKPQHARPQQHGTGRNVTSHYQHHHHHQQRYALKHKLPVIKGASLLWRYNRGV